jgi:23S rRNA pseudouridine1911/1915/1917 synthase
VIPLPVFFEDDDLLIVDKPAGLVVHPTYRNPDGTLLDAIAARASAR